MNIETINELAEQKAEAQTTMNAAALIVKETGTRLQSALNTFAEENREFADGEKVAFYERLWRQDAKFKENVFVTKCYAELLGGKIVINYALKKVKSDGFIGVLRYSPRWATSDSERSFYIAKI